LAVSGGYTRVCTIYYAWICEGKRGGGCMRKREEFIMHGKVDDEKPSRVEGS
jgi:predicted Fe-S protein YdhL (DUF1289 family)